MSILIKGMEIPPSCSRCLMLEGDRMDGLCHAASRWLDDDEFWTWYVYPEGDMDDSKPCNCPLVPVPPHGRLIDADSLEETFCGNCFADEKPMECSEPCMDMRIILDAPTIIPAEDGER